MMVNNLFSVLSLGLLALSLSTEALARGFPVVDDVAASPNRTLLAMRTDLLRGVPGDLQLVLYNLETEEYELLVGEGFGSDSSWSSDGEEIIFVGTDRHIWSIDIDTKEQRQLSAKAHDYSHPKSSPDGQYIALISNHTGKSDLWLLELETDELIPLSVGKVRGTVDNFDWAPDGQKIVFHASSNIDRSASLYLVDVALRTVDVLLEKNPPCL